MRRAVLVSAVFGALLAVAAPASAAGSWTCEARALSASVLGGTPTDIAAANVGAPACATGTGNLTGPLPVSLPAPVTASVVSAETRLDGSAGDAASQTASAAAGVADLRVRALPDLPVALPLPSLDAIDTLRVPLLVGEVTLDLRPALEALVQPRLLPELDLLRVELARAEATARCANGAVQLTGRSTLAGVSVAGRDLGLDGALTDVVRLLDSQTIDPSNIDLTKVVAPLGLDLSVLRSVLQPQLDALPTVQVPATLARIKLTPNVRTETAGRLTHRALQAEITVAGRQIASLVIGEASVGSDGVACPGASSVRADGNGDVAARGIVRRALECTDRKLALIDVIARRGSVRLLGAAAQRYEGRRVRIRMTSNGRTVARPKVRANGLFRAKVERPKSMKRARYRAQIGRQRSEAQRATRRRVTSRLGCSTQ